MKSISIIGGGFSAWLIASIFIKKKFSVNVFEGENLHFGSQQISPNGWKALTQIVDKEDIKPVFEAFNAIHIKKINSEEILELLSNYDLTNNDEVYGSISRENLVNILKQQILSNKDVKIYSSLINHIIDSDNKIELLDTKKRIFETDFVIGADGRQGASRKFVVGSNKQTNLKKIFRAVSLDTSSYNFAKKTLQILLHSQGYFVIYPTIIKNKKATNYIFVPSNNNFSPPTFDSELLNYLIPNRLNWQISLVGNNTSEITSIFKKGVFLFGEAAFPTLPHLAQGGNQILEDAVFLKDFLEYNNNFNEMVESFIQNRSKRREIINQKSKIVGKALSSQKITGYLRNLAIQSKGKKLIEDILNEVWIS